MRVTSVLNAWTRVLRGSAPMLSIEVTRECPLSCPGCYAYGDAHLGGDLTLRELNDLRADALVEGIVRLVKRHRPVHVTLIGGEPLVRHRELSRVLPRLSAMRVNTLVVTSAVIPIPQAWLQIPRLRVAVSVDGLREDHDARRHPATYERILHNIQGRRVDISWVITQPMMRRPGYLDDYLAFWISRPEIDRIALSMYTPQVGEQSEEILSGEARAELVRILPGLKQRFPALVLSEEMLLGFRAPPKSPAQCALSKMSVNYSADLKTRVEPCVFGGSPDCGQCGCAATALIGGVAETQLLGPVRVAHVMNASIAMGSFVGRLRQAPSTATRWEAPGVKETGTAMTGGLKNP